jgi:hypothetical protein
MRDISRQNGVVDVPQRSALPLQPRAESVRREDVSADNAGAIPITLQGGNEVVDAGTERTRTNSRTGLRTYAKQLQHGLLLWLASVASRRRPPRYGECAKEGITASGASRWNRMTELDIIEPLP